MADLLLELKHREPATAYTRSLDLETALSQVAYQADGIQFKRELYVSAPDQVMAVELTADQPQAINCSLTMTCQLRSSLVVAGTSLILRGEAPSHVEPSYSKALAEPVVYSTQADERGMRFTAVAQAIVQGGQVSQSEGRIVIEQADRVVILFSAQTSFAGYNVRTDDPDNRYEQICQDHIRQAAEIGRAHV